MNRSGCSATGLRPIRVTRGFTTTAAGSVLWQQGDTLVLCTASISRELPMWFREDRPGGWLTCEYVMLPASTPTRKPWPKSGHTDGRGTEIQRLIGRTLRAVVDLSKIGPHTIAIDCQVLQADGGTRTASICGGYVALVDAIRSLPKIMPGARTAPMLTTTDLPISHGYTEGDVPARYNADLYCPSEAIVDQVSAVSVGIVEGETVVDLAYVDDSRAEVDLNVAYTAGGRFVEVQGSAENGLGFDRKRLDRMLDSAVLACSELFTIQNQALQAPVAPQTSG